MRRPRVSKRKRWRQRTWSLLNSVIGQLVKHPLTDIGIEKFLPDWKKQEKKYRLASINHRDTKTQRRA
jgi:hypothetical protein